MKFLLALMLSLLSLSPSFAQSTVPLPPLSSVEEILKLAHTSRPDFADAVYEIRNSAMERRTIEVNLSYMAILPELRKVEKELKFPEFGISPSTDLGLYLTACLARRIDIQKMTASEIELFVNWADSETIYTALEIVEKNLTTYASDEEGWKNLFNQAGVFAIAISKLPNVSKMLEDTSASFQGQVLLQYLHLFYPTIDIDDFTPRLAVLESPEALDNILKFIGFEWGKIADAKLKQKLFKVTLAVSEQMSKLKDDSVFSSLGSLGESLLFQIKDLLTKNVSFELSELEAATGYFTQKDWKELADFLVEVKVGSIASQQVESFSLLAKKSIKDWIYKEDRAKLNSLSRQLAVRFVDKKLLPEGLYMIEKGSDVFYLWILYSKPWKATGHLLSVHGDQVASYDFSEFSVAENRLTFLSKDKDGQPNTLDTQFQLSLPAFGKKMMGTLISDSGIANTKIKFIQRLPDLASVTSFKDTQLSGLVGKYDYTINFSHEDFNSIVIKLAITNPKIHMRFTSSSACFDTSIYCDFALVTSNEDNWGFLRGAMTSENEFQGFLIQGLRVTPLTLKK